MMPEKYDFAQRSTDLKRIADLELVSGAVSNDDKIQLCCLMMRYGNEPKLIDRIMDLAIRWNRSPQMLLDSAGESGKVVTGQAKLLPTSVRQTIRGQLLNCPRCHSSSTKVLESRPSDLNKRRAENA